MNQINNMEFIVCKTMLCVNFMKEQRRKFLKQNFVRILLNGRFYLVGQHVDNPMVLILRQVNEPQLKTGVWVEEKLVDLV